ncbi:TPA: hypothetical protein N2G30_003930 [Salmonella enterica]|nr:hypothetical protein [Salmonella enterica]
MKKTIQVSGWVLFSVGMVIITFLFGNEYQWMLDTDPTITTLPQDNGNRSVVRGVICCVLVAVQIVLYFLSASRYGRIFSGFGILLLLITEWSSEQ